jgi:hypothetical protein
MKDSITKSVSRAVIISGWATLGMLVLGIVTFGYQYLKDK